MPKITENNLRRALTKPRLRRFLEATPNRRATRGSACDCPLACYLRATFAVKPHVDIEFISLNSLALFTPNWAAVFISRVDRTWTNHQITFARALALLDHKERGL